jgi:hypothetical protein
MVFNKDQREGIARQLDAYTVATGLTCISTLTGHFQTTKIETWALAVALVFLTSCAISIRRKT